jgi:putative transcriptional regulator
MKEIDYFASDRLIEPGAGDLLISEPYLPDRNFERSVILVCEHNEEGTFGLVLNHPSGSKVEDVVADVETMDSDIHIGGPVQQNTLHFIHRAPDLIDHVIKVKEGLFYGGDQERLMTLIDTHQIRKDDFIFFVGYSGWSPGQLLEELKAKSWIVYQDVKPNELFDISPDDLWKHILQKMGGKFKAISNYPVDPRLN